MPSTNSLLDSETKPETHQLWCVSNSKAVSPRDGPAPNHWWKANNPLIDKWQLSNSYWDFLSQSYYFFPGWVSRLSTLCFGNLQGTWKKTKCFISAEEETPVTFREPMSVGLTLEPSGPSLLASPSSQLFLPWYHHNHSLTHIGFKTKSEFYK